MKIYVGETELAVNNCYAYRYGNGKLVLRIEVPQSEIEHDALKTLLKDNTADIVKVDGEVEETFTGFCYTLTILDRDDVYECEVECISETERKVRDMQNMIDASSEIISAQTAEIELLNETILEMLMEE